MIFYCTVFSWGNVEALFLQRSCQVRWSCASGLGLSEEYHRHGKLLKN